MTKKWIILKIKSIIFFFLIEKYGPSTVHYQICQQLVLKVSVSVLFKYQIVFQVAVLVLHHHISKGMQPYCEQTFNVLLLFVKLPNMKSKNYHVANSRNISQPLLSVLCCCILDTPLHFVRGGGSVENFEPVL